MPHPQLLWSLMLLWCFLLTTMEESWPPLSAGLWSSEGQQQCYQWRHQSVFKKVEELSSCLGLLSLEECGLLALEKRNKGLRAWQMLLMSWEEVGNCIQGEEGDGALVKVPGFGHIPHRGYSRSNDRAEQIALGRIGFSANPFYFWTKSW